MCTSPVFIWGLFYVRYTHLHLMEFHNTSIECFTAVLYVYSVTSLIIILRYVDTLTLDNLIIPVCTTTFYITCTYCVGLYYSGRIVLRWLHTFALGGLLLYEYGAPTWYIQSTSSIETYIDYYSTLCRYICIKWTSSI